MSEIEAIVTDVQKHSAEREVVCAFRPGHVFAQLVNRDDARKASGSGIPVVDVAEVHE